MKQFSLFLSLSLLSTGVMAQQISEVIPGFLSAVESYSEREDVSYAVSPELNKVHQLFKKKNISVDFLKRYASSKTAYYLPEDDAADKLLAKEASARPLLTTETDLNVDVPQISVHAVKVDDVLAADPVFKDDLYAYYFVTDGVIPTGKVTSIYKGVSSAQSFFFKEFDRVIYPSNGILAKAPHNHLIVDFGLIESDGDDIKEMQKITDIIIDIAIAVYTAKNPQAAAQVANLRKEIKALTDLILNRDKDDRLFTGTVALTNTELKDMLKDKTFVEIAKPFNKRTFLESWSYRMTFRFLKD